MSSQTVANANVTDVEKALIENYGRVNISETTLTDMKAEWTFKITSKSQGSCTAEQTPEGVAVSMSTSMPGVFKVVIVLGCLICLLPGLALLAYYYVLVVPITNAVISSRFSKFIESVKNNAEARAK